MTKTVSDLYERHSSILDESWRYKATEGILLTLEDLKQVKQEFEEINLKYRKTFTFDARLELLERVKKLVAVIRDLEIDAGDGVSK